MAGWTQSAGEGKRRHWARAAEYQEDAHQRPETELVDKEGWYHGNAPADDGVRGTLSWILGLSELSAAVVYTTIDCIMLARPTKSKVLFYQCIGVACVCGPRKRTACSLMRPARRNVMGCCPSRLSWACWCPRPHEGPVIEEGHEGGRGRWSQDGLDTEHMISIWRSAHGSTGVETPKHWVVNLADRMRVRPDGQGAYRLEVRK